MLKLFSEIFEFSLFSKENSHFERIRMVRMVRMVRSLADRTFQLWAAPPAAGVAARAPQSLSQQSASFVVGDLNACMIELSSLSLVSWSESFVSDSIIDTNTVIQHNTHFGNDAMTPFTKLMRNDAILARYVCCTRFMIRIHSTLSKSRMEDFKKEADGLISC